MVTLNLSEREAKILRGWLEALTFQGTAQQLREPLAVQAALCAKLNTILAASDPPPHTAPYRSTPATNDYQLPTND